MAGLALLNGCGQPFWDSRPSLARIGILSLYQQGVALGSQYLQAFMTGMRELGWVQDQNAVFHVRYADDGPLREMAAMKTFLWLTERWICASQ
jgi:hypothetical protein